MKAISIEEPSRLIQTLTGAILGCGGWVLSRGANDSGTITMLFEFERQACVDIYSIMIAAGLELSQNGHIRFTELCQCTCNQAQEYGSDSDFSGRDAAQHRRTRQWNRLTSSPTRTIWSPW
jgi:hypothetical protein